MWFSFLNYSYFPRFRILSVLKQRKKLSVSRKKSPIKFKFARQQKVMGKVSKSIVKKKTNIILKQFRLYIVTGIIQNLPPLSTLLSLYGVNSQKFCEELTLFLKPRFFEGIPIIIQLNIFKDFSYKFFFIGFKNIWILRNLVVSFRVLLLARSFERNLFFSDIWFIFFLWVLLVKTFHFEAFVKNMKYSFLTLMCSRFLKYKLYKFVTNEKIYN